MSMIINEFRELGGNIGSRVGRLQTMARRMTPGPALTRAAVLAAALVAQVVAGPAEIAFDRPVLILVVVALMPALLPRGGWPTVAILTAVVGWFLATTAYEQPVSYPRLVVLAGAIYLVHSLAALAAV